jgi:hypothetical protein
MRASLKAALILAFVLNLIFFPVLWGNKTLLLSSRDASSILPGGAFHQEDYPHVVLRTIDPGAPAWTIEPWLKIVSDQYWHDHEVPLWNPYAAYGKPLAASQQAQPFYPLTLLLSLHVSPRAFDFFIVARLFIAGLLMFLFAQLFLETLPALVSAVIYMLSGYFIIFMNMPHLSVEILAPGILLTFEQILRRNCWPWVSLAAIAIFCAAMGGMPESLFLVISFGCVFVLFRLLSAREYRIQPIGRLIKVAAALVLGFGLSALLLLPFIELAKVAHDVHQAANLGGEKLGLVADAPLRETVLYLVPLLFGPLGTSIFGYFIGLRAYWGLLPCLFAALAVLCCLLSRDPPYPKPRRRLTAFFAISLTLMLLKRFGNPIVNWIGELPIANLVLYPKYDEPLMALCIAMLAGIGVALVSERRVRPNYFPLAAGLLMSVMLGLVGLSLPSVLHLGRSHTFYTVLAAGMLVMLSAVAWWGLTTRPAWARWRMPALLFLLMAELFANFLLPTYYLLNTLPSQASNPYAGAPYINFLLGQDRDYSRIFGREGTLHPNWAGVFGLADVRSLDAIEYQRYFDFIRNFLLKPGDEARLHDELADRFTGADRNYSYDFTSDQEKRFLTLSSVKYLISRTAYGVSAKAVKDIIAQHQGENIWGFGEDNFPIGNGHEAAGVFQHPPSNRIAYRVRIDPSQPVFSGIVSIKTAAQDLTKGVGFTLEIKAGDSIERLFHLDLDPRAVAADRAGRQFRVDLSQYAGQDVELLFSTDPGPSGNNANDWAGWARLEFVPLDAAKAAGTAWLKPVYDREVFIYEVPGPLPRAALYSAAEVLPDSEVLNRLKAPDFDPKQKIILGQESIPSEGAAATYSFAEALGEPVRAARIAVYEPEHVRIEAETDAPAVLMLNDTDYPGWQATVNGKPAPILRADYLFRAVVLPTGKSTVDFDYEPRSFRLGMEISIVSLIGVIALPLAFRRRRKGLTIPST